MSLKRCIALGTMGTQRFNQKQQGLALFKPKGNIMRIAKKDVPSKINVPGAVARMAPDFGDATGYGKICGEYFSLGAGTDITPLLKGLEGDLCQSPHWGYLIDGEVTITYQDGKQETTSEGDLFYWPPGHTLKVGRDAEIILFSPQAEHCAVVDHLHKQLAD
jgi:hypothetical protein